MAPSESCRNKRRGGQSDTSPNMPPMGCADTTLVEPEVQGAHRSIDGAESASKPAGECGMQVPAAANKDVLPPAANQAEQNKSSEVVGSIMNWELLIMFLTIAPMAGFIIIQPYQQTRRADLNCGPVCFGSMTSVSSFLGLIGAPLVGALSDHQGRRFALTIGCISGAMSFLILGTTNSLLGLWIALIPPALLSHNFTITKAIVADLAAPDQRAGVLGKLGLAVGVGFMVGPIVHPFIQNYIQAAAIATALQLSSLPAVYFLPSKKLVESESATEAPKHVSSGSLLLKVCMAVWEAVQEVFVLAVAAPPAAKVLLFIRFGLSMGFHVFFTVMSVILNERFKYGPSDYSNYFAFFGLVYSVSQLLSKRVINRFAADPTVLVAACTFFLMVGRFITAITDNQYTLYLSLALSFGALGILNNTINTTVTQIAKSDNVGGLMGVLDTAEKLAGVVGPSVGGVLYAYHSFAPVVAVCLGYLAMIATTWIAYPRYVVPAMNRGAQESRPKAD